MASVASPPSPTSLQLRFGRSGVRPSPAFFRIQFRPSIRRPTLASAANGAGGQSWTASGRSQDSFSGWSGSHGEGGGDPRKSGDGFGGMLGAGLAGIFFTAGIVFASLSLRSKIAGVKEHMKPLTNEQELALTSEDQTAKADQVRNEDSLRSQDNQDTIEERNLESMTGIKKDLLSHTEITEDSTESGFDIIHHSETSLIENTESNYSEVVNLISQDDLQISATSPEFSSLEDVDSSLDASRLTNSHIRISSDSLDSVIKHDPNQNTTDHVALTSLSDSSTFHINGHEEVDLNHVDGPFEISSELQNRLPTSTLELDDTEDPLHSTAGGMDTESTELEKEDILHNDALKLPAEAITLHVPVDDNSKNVPFITTSGSDLDQTEAMMLPSESISSFEEHMLDKTGLSVPYPAEVFVDPRANEPDLSSQSQIARSSTFESTSPEKSISYAGIPAPSFTSAALQVSPGRVLVPAVVDQVQGQALTALQVLKVIEADAQPGDLCTRREYARWLVSASSALSRNPISKVYPAMYIENVTELAFDDITPDDPDYSFIQGLAEAGIISSKLSKSDNDGTSSGYQRSFLFSSESPVSRQDLVSWKMALEKRQLPEVDRNYLYKCSGYIDIDKIDKDAWPALVADLSAGEQGITALAFGYTRLFQPNKPVTKAQAAIALSTGDSADVVVEELTRIEAESLAETAVNAHTDLVAQVEKEINANFEAELTKEREKTSALEKLAEEARLELERLRAEREEQNNALVRGRAAVESEIEVLSRLRHEVEEQLQELMSNKLEISFERDRISKLQKEAESGNQVIVQLQYELEVERKALSMARAWAEEEAKRAREQAKALEEARYRWEKHGIQVVVDEDLQEDASAGVTWLTAGQQAPADETINRAENLVGKLKAMGAKLKIRSSAAIERMIQKILAFISTLKTRAHKGAQRAGEFQRNIVAKANTSLTELKETASGLSSSVSEKARRAIDDCKEGVERFSQKFKT